MQPDRHRRYLLSLVVVVGIAAIAYLDYSVRGNVSLGYLYILPLIISASIHRLPMSLGLVLVCVGLREWFGPFQEQTQTPIVRGLLTTVGFLTVVVIVNQTENRRHRLSEAIRIQADMLRRDLQIAAEVQRRMLPQKPLRIKGYEVATRMDPAKIVGGDYYDYLELPSRGKGFVLADVCGKGASGALLISAVRTSLRAAALTSPGPDKTLESVNDALCEVTHRELFVSLFYGCIEAEARTLTYSNGGHHPPFVIKNSSREMVLLETGGPVLGLLPRAQYESGSVQLQPGDLLVLYTDGLVEAENPKGEQYSQERLVSLIRSHQGLTAPELIESVYQSVDEFRGSSLLEDDSTLLVIKAL